MNRPIKALRKNDMNKYVIRPYFAHDCDSFNGFNNGYYLDDVIIMAINADEARTQALDSYVQGLDNTDDISTDVYGEYTVSCEFGYTDGAGNDITEAEYMENSDNEGYGHMYQYVSFDEVHEE